MAVSKVLTRSGFSDRTRSDVILQDRHGVTVLVECKQHAPTIENVDQVLRYRHELKKTRGTSYAVRLMLVHGGSWPGDGAHGLAAVYWRSV